MFEVRYSRPSTKVLLRVPRTVARRIRDRIVDVAADPYADHPNVTRLRDREGYRLRVGDWRVIYELDDGEKILTVIAVGPRGQAYR